MTDKAVVTRIGVDQDQARMDEATGARRVGLNVETTLPYGSVVVADERPRAELEELGFRVAVLRETNILGIGNYRIDTDTGRVSPSVPADFQVPDAQRGTWRHHLVQLKAPPSEEWTDAIAQQQGITVVEPISRYGLFVVGDPALVEALPQQHAFVSWTGLFEPAYRVADGLMGREGRVEYVSIGVYPPDQIGAVEAELPRLNARKIKGNARPEADPDDDFATLLIEIDRTDVPALAGLPDVRWLEYAAPEPRLLGEREVQIVAGNLVGGVPQPGYLAWLASLGLSGSGIGIAICDTGVDTNANLDVDGHIDFRGWRSNQSLPYAGSRPADRIGHGTAVASIAIGNAATNKHEGDDAHGFLWGLGVAPGASFIAQNAVDSSLWPPTTGELAQLTRDVAAAGAQVMNNSWYIEGSTGYTGISRQFDRLARDANLATHDAQEHLVFVNGAGNEGPPQKSIRGPHEAKNVITVGATHSHRGDGNADMLWRKSSRGPAHDDRVLPTVVAPGADISTARGSRASGIDRIPGTGTWNGTHWVNGYSLENWGTSFAAPHVAGCCALIIEWWRNEYGDDEKPTPAMVKALLVNGADDLVGGGLGIGEGGFQTNIPNTHQGWGRANLRNIVDAGRSGRGPRICVDDADPFTATHQWLTYRISPADERRPMRITLVWTDAPAAVNAVPTRVNDLNLSLTKTPGGPTYKGNRFQNGFSIPGGDYQDLDNVECIYLARPSGVYEVCVFAESLSRNARWPFNRTPWQDFALVMDNAKEVP